MSDNTRPDSVTVPLEVPIKRGEKEIEQVTLRRPKSGALRGVKMLELANLDYDAVKTVLPRISDPTLTGADVDGMDPADVMSCAVEIGGFLAGNKARTDSPPT